MPPRLSLLAALALIAAGCTQGSSGAGGAPVAGGQPNTSNGNNEGNFLERATFKPAKPTNENVEGLVYLDYSPSSEPIRPQGAEDLKNLFDNYPDAIRAHVFAYYQDVRELGSVVCSPLNLKSVCDDFMGADIPGKNTYLGKAFESIEHTCRSNPKKQYVAALVSDAGYEDDPAPQLRKLASVPNLKAIYVLGVQAGTMEDGTVSKKLSTMRALFDRVPEVKPILVTSGNASELDDAKRSLRDILTQNGTGAKK